MPSTMTSDPVQARATWPPSTRNRLTAPATSGSTRPASSSAASRATVSTAYAETATPRKPNEVDR